MRQRPLLAVIAGQLAPTDQVFNGDGTKRASYSDYGAPVHSVAAGTVVNRYDETDEQTSNRPVKGINTESIGGNMLVIDIGGDNYAFYAHLHRGSLKVNPGYHVAAGQVIRLLGNTTAPHLRSHQMDGRSPLNTNRRPFAVTHFTSRGVTDLDATDDPMKNRTSVKIDSSRLTGRRTNEMPLNNEVIDFQ